MPDAETSAVPSRDGVPFPTVLMESPTRIRCDTIEHRVREVLAETTVLAHGHTWSVAGLGLSLSAEKMPQYHARVTALLRSGRQGCIHEVDLAQTDRLSRFVLMELVLLLVAEDFNEDIVFGTDLIDTDIARHRALRHLLLPDLDLVYDPTLWKRYVKDERSLEAFITAIRDLPTNHLRAQAGLLIMPPGPFSAHETIARNAGMQDAFRILAELNGCGRRAEQIGADPQLAVRGLAPPAPAP